MSRVPQVGLPLLSPGGFGQLPLDTRGASVGNTIAGISAELLAEKERRKVELERTKAAGTQRDIDRIKQTEEATTATRKREADIAKAAAKARLATENAAKARRMQIWKGEIAGATRKGELAAKTTPPEASMEAYSIPTREVFDRISKDENLTPIDREELFAATAASRATSRQTAEAATTLRLNEAMVRDVQDFTDGQLDAAVTGNPAMSAAADSTAIASIDNLLVEGFITPERHDEMLDDWADAKDKKTDEVNKAAKTASRDSIAVWKMEDAALYAEDVTQDRKDTLNDEFSANVRNHAKAGFITREYAELQIEAHASKLQAVEDAEILDITNRAKKATANPRSLVSTTTLLDELAALPASAKRTGAEAAIFKMIESEKETYKDAELYLAALDSGNFTKDTPRGRNTREAAYLARTNKDDPKVMAVTALAMRRNGDGLPDAFRADLGIMAGGGKGRDAVGAQQALRIIQAADPAEAVAIAEGIGVRARMLLYVSTEDAALMDREGATNALADAGLYLSGDSQLTPPIPTLPIEKSIQDTNNLPNVTLTGDQLNNWVAKYRMEFIRMMTVEGFDESKLDLVRDESSRRASEAFKNEFTALRVRGETQLTPVDDGLALSELPRLVAAADRLSFIEPAGGFPFGRPMGEIERLGIPRANLPISIGDETFFPITDRGGNLLGVFDPAGEAPNDVITKDSKEWPVMLETYRTDTPRAMRRTDADIVYNAERGYSALSQSDLLFQRASDVFANGWFTRHGDMPRDDDPVTTAEYDRQFADYVTGDEFTGGLNYPSVFPPDDTE